MAGRAQFNTGGGPAKPRVASALQAKMAALERTLSEGTMGTPATFSLPKPVMGTLGASRAEDVEPSFPKPSSLRGKPALTPGNSEPSTIPFPRPPVLKPPVNATFNKANVFPAPGNNNPPWMKEHQTESTAVAPHPPKLPGFPKLPDAAKPKLPGVPNLPDVAKPKFPGAPKPPDAAKPKPPGAPNLPDAPKPKLLGVPKLPDAPKPKPPDAPKPKTPSTSSYQESQFAQSQTPSLISIPKRDQSATFIPPSLSHLQNSFNKKQGVTGGIAVAKEALRTFNPSAPVIPKPPPTTQKPKSGTPDEPFSLTESTDPSLPKKNPLPPMFSLGSPPQKPNRPPDVDLQRFQKNGVSLNDGSLQTKPYGGVRSLAMRTPQPQEEQEFSSSDDNYEDIEEDMKPITPSLPSREHPSQQIEAEFSDGDMYEDLDERWPVQETIETNNSKEIPKKDKKQLQQEKKLQEAKEKREQEARKKFKIKGPVQVVFEATVRLDCKKGKTDLALKKGETIDVIRVTDNPEGRWLARNTDGCYGYVKTDSIDIDTDRLKKQSSTMPNNSSESDQDIYDDIGPDVSSDGQGQNGEDDDDDDDYVVVEDECFPPPPPPTGDEDDFYDDVGSAPPPLDCLPQPATVEVMDPKKKKTFDKEEKEFRKKFKFVGEIQVLYSVTIATTLTNKKWGNKDLPLNPEEEIDVIEEAVDGKLIGRNREGKFGYVAMVNVAQHDDIYDDIGEDCIYDN